MKAIVVMFDSLNRHFLPPYGCDWTQAPNFQRLAQRTLTFDNSYVCSMPCMPARRDFHTARPNFLHRSWGPMEPFDDSVPKLLSQAGISSHLITDHQHYWEAGGATYHTCYDTWQFHRGQEGDAWMGQVEDPPEIDALGRNAETDIRAHRQDRVNRQFMPHEQDQPQARTFEAGVDFIRRNHAAQDWFLQLETFDPHEPFFTQRHFKDLYPDHYADYDGPLHDWPPYAKVTETPEQVEHMRYEYASLLSMCDRKLGDVLDLMDELELWEDTMLIVWTDHGFLLSEHDVWAKCWVPFYNEVAQTPFFVWDPRNGQQGERRQALVQPAIDLGPTLLNFFGQEPTSDMLGKDLADTIQSDTDVRQAAIYGQHGHQVNVTDGRYVYMRGPVREDNQPLYDYTLMPTHMREPFGVEELRGRIELADPFSFTKDCQLMRIGGDTGEEFAFLSQVHKYGSSLYDLQNDPGQLAPIQDEAVEQRLIASMAGLMAECDTPAEQYERLGLAQG
ncbi:MAG: sulfatase [Gemmatimonadetes bacterium]|jgi:arylsulfatase A-like enzyme|nr:sulfatase [Gemmatimonadota bacterium]MBT6147259.1 sulfatase [Gemmatimonadota bacterium]MBT7862506.1 sulfatase [Gemmatimonadota bacterium]